MPCLSCANETAMSCLQTTRYLQCNLLITD